jgi:SAM-dependent methyltransferase
MTDQSNVVIGADVDVRALMAEVDQEVRRKRDAGLYPPEVLGELELPPVGGDGAEPESLAPALADMQRTSRFTALVTVASRKPVVAPLVTQARRAIRTALTWYMNGILEQISRFADSSVRAVGLVAERTSQLDGRVATLETRLEGLDSWAADVDSLRAPERLTRLERSVRELRKRLEDGAPAQQGKGAGATSWQAERNFDYLEFENRFRGGAEEIADRQRLYVDEFRDAAAPVVDLGCGRGEFLGLLRDAGIPCYGVDRHPDMIATTRDRGFEVVEADALEHLAAAPPGSLGGIFSAQMVEHLVPAEVPTLFELAWEALAPGAPLVVETINPESLFVFAHAFYVDLGHLRPLHPLTLEFLAQATGFSSARIEYLSPPPADFRPQPLPEVDEEPLAGVVASLEENFRRIDDILFGPQDFAVIARR